MKTIYRDIISTLLAVLGAVIIFAKLNSYTWWLIGSWTGALAVVAIIGLAVMLTNIVDIVRSEDVLTFAEVGLWILAASVVLPSLIVETTRLEFIWCGIFLGVAWLAQTLDHVWHSTDNHHLASTS